MLKCTAAIALALMLAGCTGAVQREEASVSIQASEVSIDGNQQKLISCDSDGVVDYTVGASDGGRVTVQVKDGGGFLIGSEELSPGKTGSFDVAGGDGKWLLRVDRDATFDGTFKVTLTC
ncbi:MAG: hypothetical protein ACPHK8_01325 [Thermoplasmatota archaeon]